MLSAGFGDVSVFLSSAHNKNTLPGVLVTTNCRACLWTNTCRALGESSARWWLCVAPGLRP